MRRSSSCFRANRTLAGLVVAGSFFAACDQVREVLPFGADHAAPEAAPPDSTGTTDEQPPVEAEDLPDTIYYDLTKFGWYARAEPLRLGGVDYVPGRPPVAASATAMERLGAYEGVAVYGATQEGDTVVYVPVFEGFWLPFVRRAPGNGN